MLLLLCYRSSKGPSRVCIHYDERIGLNYSFRPLRYRVLPSSLRLLTTSSLLNSAREANFTLHAYVRIRLWITRRSDSQGLDFGRWFCLLVILGVAPSLMAEWRKDLRLPDSLEGGRAYTPFDSSTACSSMYLIVP